MTYHADMTYKAYQIDMKYLAPERYFCSLLYRKFSSIYRRKTLIQRLLYRELPTIYKRLPTYNKVHIYALDPERFSF